MINILNYNGSNCAGEFCGLVEIKEGYNSIIYCNIDENPPEFFPKDLLIFANSMEEGYVCFD